MGLRVEVFFVRAVPAWSERHQCLLHVVWDARHLAAFVLLGVALALRGLCEQRVHVAVLPLDILTVEDLRMELVGR